jgi:hypothetical protein
MEKRQIVGNTGKRNALRKPAMEADLRASLKLRRPDVFLPKRDFQACFIHFSFAVK